MKKLILLLICFIGCRSNTNIKDINLISIKEGTQTRIIQGTIYGRYSNQNKQDWLNIYSKNGSFIETGFFSRKSYYFTIITNDNKYIAVEVSEDEHNQYKIGDKWSNIQVEVK